MKSNTATETSKLDFTGLYEEMHGVEQRSGELVSRLTQQVENLLCQHIGQVREELQDVTRRQKTAEEVMEEIRKSEVQMQKTLSKMPMEQVNAIHEERKLKIDDEDTTAKVDDKTLAVAPAAAKQDLLLDGMAKFHQEAEVARKDLSEKMDNVLRSLELFRKQARPHSQGLRSWYSESETSVDLAPLPVAEISREMAKEVQEEIDEDQTKNPQSQDSGSDIELAALPLECKTLDLPPGKISVIMEEDSGRVVEVKEGLAKMLGVQPGWIVQRLDDEPYSCELLESKQNGDGPYQMTFSQGGGPEGVNSSNASRQVLRLC